MVLTPAEFVVCGLALVRRLWRSLPYFTAYLVLLVIVEGVRASVNLATSTSSRSYIWTYWMTQPVLILARGAGLVDVFRAALGMYSGVWRFARSMLIMAAAFMLLFAAVHTGETPRISSYLIFLERELEFAAVLSLLLLLVVCRYYGAALARPLDGIALGLGFYSSVVIISGSILIGPLTLPWWQFSLVRSVAYFMTVCLWGYSLWAPLPERAGPQLSSMESYEQNTLAVSDRMRELNDRLSNLMKR
jgi:hypothetical protein